MFKLRENTYQNCVWLFFCVNISTLHPALQILVYAIFAQVVRLTTLPIDFRIKLPTKWYIATLVPGGVQ